MLALTLANLTDGIGEERLVGVISGIKLEEGLAPVMCAVGLLEVIVGQHRDVFRAVQNAILMPIVDDLMSTGCHHLPELNYLLRIGTSVKFLACNSVRKS